MGRVLPRAKCDSLRKRCVECRRARAYRRNAAQQELLALSHTGCNGAKMVDATPMSLTTRVAASVLPVNVEHAGMCTGSSRWVIGYCVGRWESCRMPMLMSYRCQLRIACYPLSSITSQVLKRHVVAVLREEYAGSQMLDLAHCVRSVLPDQRALRCHQVDRKRRHFDGGHCRVAHFNGRKHVFCVFWRKDAPIGYFGCPLLFRLGISLTQ